MTLMTLKERITVAQSVARWANHQWGSATLTSLDELDESYSPEEIVQWIAAATRATTQPGAVGWGVMAPEVNIDKEVIVRIGKDKQLNAWVKREGIAVAYSRPERYCYCMLTVDQSQSQSVNWSYSDPEPRDFARCIAVLKAAGLHDVLYDKVVQSVSNRFRGEAKQEFMEYVSKHGNAGHVLAGRA